MSTSAQKGHIAWTVQTGKIGENALDRTNYTWYRHRAESVNLGVNDFYDVLPQEVGGSLFVNSSYKNGAFVAGGARIYTRLQNNLGYLLHGAAGYATAQSGGGTAANKTTFMVKPSDQTQMAWMALRKFTPATSGATGASEYFADCRVNMLTLNVPAMGPTMAEFSVIGRKPSVIDGDGADTDLDSEYESGVSLAHSCKGVISLPGINTAVSGFSSNGKFTSAQIMIANNISQPDQQMVIGSYHPDDLVPLSRSVQIRLIYKWYDAALYKKLFYNGTSAWSPIVQNSDITISTASVNNISGSIAEPYKMRFTAPDVDWTMSPPQLAGNNLLFTEFTGIVKSTSTTIAPWWIDLWNTATYSDIVG